MFIYLAGGVSANLNPAWKYMAKTEISPSGFIEGLKYENFLGRNQRTEMDSNVIPRGGYP